MDITRFINSEDVAEHFRTAFDADSCTDLSLRYAWLIWQSKGTALEERHAAWQEIIDTMPDQEIPSGTMRGKSLHECLRQYMALEKQLIEAIRKDDHNAVFQYQIRKEDLSLKHRCWETGWELYPDFQSCCSACREEVHRDALGIRIEKQWAASGTKMIRALFSPNAKTLIAVGQRDYLAEEDMKVLALFDELNFSFPIPFRRGDLLQRVNSHSHWADPHLSEEVFIFDHIEGMKAYGYFRRRSGEIYKDYVENYMNLAYCREPEEKQPASLLTLGFFFRNEIDIELLLNVYYLVLTEEKHWQDQENLRSSREKLDQIRANRSEPSYGYLEIH